MSVMNFQAYEQVEKAMMDFVEQSFMKAPFLTTLQTGGYTDRQIQYFAVQYSYYSRHFPRVLGAAIAAMAPFSHWWIPLADNLWDEAGRGEPGKAHDHLYMTFLQSVAPDLAMDALTKLPQMPMADAVRRAIDTFLQFFQEATPLEAMAAVGLGSELFAGRVMGAIGKGFRHPAYQKGQGIQTLFWDCHADEHEPRHYQLCKAILLEHVNLESLSVYYDIGVKIAGSEATMYHQLHEDMLLLT